MTTENAAERERRLIVRAGLFIALGLLLFGLVVLLIGRERRLFDRQIAYHMSFENVEGLKRDSPVWLGGLEVGRVTRITFSPDLGDKRIDVQVEMSSRYKDRVRSDSVARVGSRGVLGDKAIDITLGTAQGDPTPPGGEIQSGTSGDIASLLKRGGEIIDNVTVVTRDLRTVASGYADPRLQKNLAATIASLASILGTVERGPGTVHALIYDGRTSRDVQALIARASDVAVQVDHAAARVDGILASAKDGRGALHALLYDPKGGEAIGHLGDAAEQLAVLVRDARESKTGAIHQLVYGDAKDLFADLGRMANDLQSITSKVRAGEGTLGALVVDPSIYDDLRTILGNVKRNVILRALVRLTVSHRDEIEAAGKPVQEGVRK